MAQAFYQTLINQHKSIGERYQAVFELKNMANSQAIQLLIKAYPFCGSSILLKHQLLYALGQLPDQFYPIFVDFLIQKVKDEEQNNLSRHQAAQALANYFREDMIPLYEEHLKSNCNELRWTCEIAYEKVKNHKLKELYGTQYNKTMEPAAPFTEKEFKQFIQNEQYKKVFEEKGFLGLLLLNSVNLFNKYRIMYYMRDLNNEECRKSLCMLLSKEYFKTQTSLLKHQVCFVLGQIGCEGYEHLIRECLQNEEEEDIVRHQALAAVASQSKDYEYLQKFVHHPSQLVRESALVAQFTIKYWHQ